MLLSEFDYHLPRERIASTPAEKRDHSRLLVLDRRKKDLEFSRFFKLGEYLKEGDLLVLNNTRVLPARLLGRRETGAHVEGLLLQEKSPRIWEALLNARGRVKDGDRISFEDGALHAVVNRAEEGIWIFEFEEEDVVARLEQCGRAPIPPYIHHWRDRQSLKAMDKERYQTVYAEQRGAIAAPTAGLHFTKDMLSGLEARGVNATFVTLHVGWGTFQTIHEEEVEKHRMHREYYRLSSETVEQVEAARSGGGRVLAVGTTCVRVLETAAATGALSAGEGWTDLYVYPGFSFRVVDAMITNFHLPKSSLLLLVAAFAGKEKILNAYQEAIAADFRFYSYGDAMLIL